YDDNNRPDAAARERAEIAVLERYLPAAVGEDELAAIVAEEVARAAADGATGGKAMGTVIKAVKARAGATADGAGIGAAVNPVLTPEPVGGRDRARCRAALRHGTRARRGHG